jgi:hypothetical protein
MASLFASAAVVLYALASGSSRRHYDVDEIQHTHVMWRISVGDRPFHDFVESHPPFVWYLGALVLPRFSTPGQALSVFRFLAAALGVLFVGLMLACAKACQTKLEVPWLAAAGLLVLCERRNLDYFLEARPDSVAYCLLFVALLLFLRGTPGPLFPRYSVFSFLASTAVLWTPKLALLVVALALADLIFRFRSKRGLLPSLAGHATGILLSAGCALAFLEAVGIDPLLALDLSIGFHERFLAETSFRYGLLRSLFEQPVQLLAALLGIATWLVLTLSKRIEPSALEIAALCFLTAAPLLVPLPYKQYYVPWFALSAIFLPFVGIALEGKRAAASSALISVLAFSALSSGSAARDYRERNQVEFFHHVWKEMSRAADPKGRVVADPQWHPIFRRDVFYAWFITFDPGGQDQERILREWNPRGYGKRFTLEEYREEIARNPPALLVTIGAGFNLPEAQEAAVEEYLRAHRGEYKEVPLAGTLGLLVKRSGTSPSNHD